MSEFFDGYKNYIFGAMFMLLSAVKYQTDIEFIESIVILGISEPGNLVSAGIAWILGRNALKKLEA